eukprot:1160439-Pelagomonas_calceolata.AAC.8
MLQAYKRKVYMQHRPRAGGQDAFSQCKRTKKRLDVQCIAKHSSCIAIAIALPSSSKEASLYVTPAPSNFPNPSRKAVMHSLVHTDCIFCNQRCTISQPAAYGDLTEFRSQ